MLIEPCEDKGGVFKCELCKAVGDMLCSVSQVYDFDFDIDIVAASSDIGSCSTKHLIYEYNLTLTHTQ